MTAKEWPSCLGPHTLADLQRLDQLEPDEADLEWQVGARLADGEE